MTQKPSLDLIRSANGAVGAFNVILIEHAEALVEAAEIANKSIVLQISENCVKYHGALKPIALATKAIIESSNVPLSLHLDHAEEEILIKEALDLGFDSIMYDGSKLPYLENVEMSKEITKLCRSYNATIEVELGEVGGKDGVHAPGARTNPIEAKKFVEETGVDLLAVAVGTSHGQVTRKTDLDYSLIKELANTVPTPLVLHGSSGVSDENLKKAVRAGMRKVNIATHLNHVFTDEIRAFFSSNPEVVDPRKYIDKARSVVAEETSRLIALLDNSKD
jgi:fructose-bisphosphate aldolase, class II